MRNGAGPRDPEQGRERISSWRSAFEAPTVDGRMGRLLRSVAPRQGHPARQGEAAIRRARDRVAPDKVDAPSVFPCAPPMVQRRRCTAWMIYKDYSTHR